MASREKKKRKEREVPVGGRWLAVSEAYRLEKGDEALERVRALPDPSELLRRRPAVDQLALVPDGEYRARMPSEAELYARERAAREQGR